MVIRNPSRYLDAVVEEYREDVISGFPNEYEAKRALWKTAVIIFETADNPDPWLDEIRDIALDVIRPQRIAGTIRSAERRANSDV